jgi:hypothetical protein
MAAWRPTCMRGRWAGHRSQLDASKPSRTGRCSGQHCVEGFASTFCAASLNILKRGQPGNYCNGAAVACISPGQRMGGSGRVVLNRMMLSSEASLHEETRGNPPPPNFALSHGPHGRHQRLPPASCTRDQDAKRICSCSRSTISTLPCRSTFRPLCSPNL